MIHGSRARSLDGLLYEIAQKRERVWVTPPVVSDQVCGDGGCCWVDVVVVVAVDVDVTVVVVVVDGGVVLGGATVTVVGGGGAGVAAGGGWSLKWM